MSRRVSVEEIMAKFRRSYPSSHVFKIDNFSLLKKYEIEDCESSVFQIGGYKWKLILYPNGNVNDNGKGHVSIYLEIQDSNSLPSNWQLKVYLTLFILNQKRESGQAEEGQRVFKASKIKSGAAKLLRLDTLYDDKKGYLVDDCALFGTQIEIMGRQHAEIGTAECFTLMEKPPNNKVTWKMARFSAFSRYPKYSSAEFIVGDRKWRITVYPKEKIEEEEKENWLSVFLEGGEYVEKALKTKTKTFVKFKLRVLDQIQGKHFQPSASYWFPVEPIDYGFPMFMPLEALCDSSNGFLKDDTLYVGVEIDAISTTRPC